MLDNTMRRLLRNHRKAKALTQAALAALLGLPQSFIAKIETGERRITAAELIMLCHHLGIDVQELVAQVLERMEQRHAIDKASNVAASKSRQKRNSMSSPPPDQRGDFEKKTLDQYPRAED